MSLPCPRLVIHSRLCRREHLLLVDGLTCFGILPSHHPMWNVVLWGRVESSQNLGCLREALVSQGSWHLLGGLSGSDRKLHPRNPGLLCSFPFPTLPSGLSLSLPFRQKDMETASSLQYGDNSTGPSCKQGVRKHKAPWPSLHLDRTTPPL